MTSETKTETTASESKERLCPHIVAAGSSHLIEEAIDKVVSWLAALL
jgi:hypothetical protein